MVLFNASNKDHSNFRIAVNDPRDWQILRTMLDSEEVSEGQVDNLFYLNQLYKFKLLLPSLTVNKNKLCHSLSNIGTSTLALLTRNTPRDDT